MDSLTHLVAGALTPLAVGAPRSRAFILFGIVCGEFPDIDVIAGKSPEAILSLHRGITHALVLQPLFALGLALAFYALRRGTADMKDWTFGKTWAVALLALCIHLFLDCMTTFGTKIFLPFSPLRVALPAMYIIDFLLTVPLVAACIFALRHKTGPAATRVARGALLWLVCYPLAALALNAALTAHLTRAQTAPGNAQGNAQGITRLELSPEPFAPFVWKAVGIAPDAYYMGRVLLARPGDDPAFVRYERVVPAMWDRLRHEEPLFALYGDFVAYPVQVRTQRPDGLTAYTFRDVRYETTLPGLMQRVGRGDGIFLLEATFAGDALRAWRFLYRGRDRDVTPWQGRAGTQPQPDRRATGTEHG